MYNFLNFIFETHFETYFIIQNQSLFDESNPGDKWEKRQDTNQSRRCIWHKNPDAINSKALPFNRARKVVANSAGRTEKWREPPSICHSPSQRVNEPGEFLQGGAYAHLRATMLSRDRKHAPPCVRIRELHASWCTWMCACTCARVRVCARVDAERNEGWNGTTVADCRASRRPLSNRTRHYRPPWATETEDERAGWSTTGCAQLVKRHPHTHTHACTLQRRISRCWWWWLTSLTTTDSFDIYDCTLPERCLDASVWRWVSSMIGGGDVKFSVSADEPQWVLYRFVWLLSSVSHSLSLTHTRTFPVFRSFSDNTFLLRRNDSLSRRERTFNGTCPCVVCILNRCRCWC